jgi:hypothetical protein
VPSNRFILILAAAAAISLGVFRLAAGALLPEMVIHAVGAGVFTTLGWAAGREIDPDHNLSAAVAAVLTIAALFVWPIPNLLLAGGLMAALRMVTRSTGLPLRLTDSLALVALAAISIVLDGFWMLGVVMALAFLFNGLLPKPDRPNSLIFALVTLGVTFIVGLLVEIPVWNRELDPGFGAITVLTGLMYLAVILRDPPTLQSVGDYDGQPLLRRRVLAAQLLALAAVMALELRAGMVGVVALVPVWAAIAGVVVRWIVQFIRA